MAQHSKRKSLGHDSAGNPAKKSKVGGHQPSLQQPSARANGTTDPTGRIAGEAEDDFGGFDSDTGGKEQKNQTPPSKKSKGYRATTYKERLQAEEAQKSRESHKKQKELAAQRKAAKPNADDIARAKKLWEKLRLKSHVQKEERQQLLTELFEIITGRVHDFVFKHDSVRVIQCAIKYSTIPQKNAIAKELKGSYRSLAESKYAKFLLAKLITDGDEETQNIIITEFYGHVRRLLNHPEASWILDDVYRSVATPEHKARILRELYSPEFSLASLSKDMSKKPSADLPALLKAEPAKRKPILDFLHERINQLIQKKMTGFTILHDAMLQYFRCLSPDSEEFSAFVRLVIGDNKEEETDLLRNLAFTSSGSEIVSLVLAHSPAKDRRAILKAYKDVMEMLAYDQHGHRILLTAFEVMDDTREIISRIFSETILLTKTATEEDQAGKVCGLALHPIGHVTLLYPFIGAERRLIPFKTLQLMQKVRKLRETTSKKDPATRRNELLAALQPPCLKAIEARASDLVASSYGCQLVTESLIEGQGEKKDSLEAVAKAVEGDPAQEAHVSTTPWAGKMLKTLIAGGRWDKATRQVVALEPPLGFADILYASVEPHVKAWILGDGAFTINALLGAEWQDQSHLATIKKAVRECKSELQQCVKYGDSAAESDNDYGDKKRRSTSAKLLLEAIS